MSWPTAIHESSHCTTAFLLGATVGSGPASIVPGKSFHGITWPGRAPKHREADERHIAAPLALLPARIRRSYESHVMICYSGYIGEGMHAHREPEQGNTCFPAGREPGIAELPHFEMPPRERELLDTAVARDTSQSDMAKAWEALLTLHFDDDDMAMRHGRLLSAQTELILSGRTPTRMIMALAGELMVHKELPARQWKKILADAAR